MRQLNNYIKMISFNDYILEKLHVDKDTTRTKLDDEMDEWDERANSPFGKCLREIQQAVIDLELYPEEEGEWGLTVYTPFDHYITMYALDGDEQYTYNHIYAIIKDWDWLQETKLKNLLRKLKRLIP